MSSLRQRAGKGEEDDDKNALAKKEKEKGTKGEPGSKDKGAKTTPDEDNAAGSTKPKGGAGPGASSKNAGGQAIRNLAMLLLAVSLALCAAALLEANPAAAAAALTSAGLTAPALKQWGIELPGMVGAHLASHSGGSSGSGDDMVWFDAEGTDGMPKAKYEQYLTLWEDAVAYHQEERLQVLRSAPRCRRSCCSFECLLRSCSWLQLAAAGCSCSWLQLAAAGPPSRFALTLRAPTAGRICGGNVMQRLHAMPCHATTQHTGGDRNVQLRAGGAAC